MARKRCPAKAHYSYKIGSSDYSEMRFCTFAAYSRVRSKRRASTSSACGCPQRSHCFVNQKRKKKHAALPDGKTARSARPFVPHIRRNGRSKTQSDPQRIGSSAPHVFRAKVYSSSEALSVFLPEGGFLTIPITTSKAITAEHISLTYGTSAPNCPATSAIALAADIQNS